jgi:methionine-rich copper-binding protein CopC
VNAAPLAAAALVVFPAPALAFVELDRAEPRVGATVAVAPRLVVLKFSEEVSADASGDVRDAAGVRVDLGGLRIDHADRQRALLKLKTLGAGEYTVRWRAKADDGDETQGRFLFRVAP